MAIEPVPLRFGEMYDMFKLCADEDTPKEFAVYLKSLTPTWTKAQRAGIIQSFSELYHGRLPN